MNKSICSIAVFCAFTVLTAGCKPSQSSPPLEGGSITPGAQPSSAQPAGKPGAATYVTASALPNQFTTATITDPSLKNIPSATLTIPAGWKLEGITMISACTFSPWPVFRAYSPDALMQMRIEPVVGWQWHPALKGTFNSGCANISGQISAADFLQYYLGTIEGGVHVVGTMPISTAYQQGAQGYAANLTQIAARTPAAMRNSYTADTAALRIQMVNGSFLVEERLRTEVECSIGSNASPSQVGGTCWARVDVLTAPLGELDALVQLVDSNSLPHGVNSAQWTQAALQRQQQQGQKAMAALTAQEKQESKMIYQQFQQIMQRSAAEHQAFMRQQESQFANAMNNANASMKAQSFAAADWVDYSLDKENVMNSDGSTTKVTAGYSQTWTNGTQWYQTDIPNSNPNGVLSGNWTPTTKVHGNGAPK